MCGCVFINCFDIYTALNALEIVMSYVDSVDIYSI